MTTILDRIVADKRTEVAQAKADLPEAALRERLPDAPAPRDFLAALISPATKGATAGLPSSARDNSPEYTAGQANSGTQDTDTQPNQRVVTQPGRIRLIAEVKRASPSAGLIREDFDPVEIAQIYQRHGADCLSVLTDEPYFQGSLDYLVAVRRAVDLPVLRKDFVIDPYQVVEARAAGADAVLLIAECLDGASLAELHTAVVELGMTPLVELHDRENLGRVLDVGARLVGINNRDLHTFKTDLQHTIELRQQIPPDRAVVGESGIRTREDVERLESAGVNAILVGQSLMESPDIGTAVDALLGK